MDSKILVFLAVAILLVTSLAVYAFNGNNYSNGQELDTGNLESNTCDSNYCIKNNCIQQCGGSCGVSSCGCSK